MTPADVARRLLSKARQDEVALAKLGDDPAVADETVGFHAQQAVEKALKAVLLSLDGRMRRTHDLERLFRAAAQRGGVLPCTVEDVADLTPFAVEYRYGDLADDIEEPLDRNRIRKLVADLLTWAVAKLTEHPPT